MEIRSAEHTLIEGFSYLPNDKNLSGETVKNTDS